jgi:hypothetical protein
MADYTFLVDNTPKELPNPVIDVFWDRRNPHKQQTHKVSTHWTCDFHHVCNLRFTMMKEMGIVP